MGRPKRKVSTSSEDDVMVMSSDGEEENKDPSLNEKAVSSILTRVTRSGRKSSRTNLTDQKNFPLGTKLKNAKDNGATRDLIEIDSDSESEDTPPPKKRKTTNSRTEKEPNKDPLDDSEDLDSEFEKLESLKEILSKSSVSITLHGSKVLPNDPGSSAKTLTLKKPPLAGKEATSIPGRTGVTKGSINTGDKTGKDPASVGQTQTNKLQTPGRIKPGIQSQPRLPGNTVVRSVSSPPVVRPSMRPVGRGRPPVVPVVKPGVTPVKAVVRPAGKQPTVRDPVVKAPEKAVLVKEKKLPKVIDRGPVDCFDTLIVETSAGFPCNYCEKERLFAKRREMIAHMQDAHKDELVSDEQRNPDMSGLFPCSVCGNIFHSKFTRRTHEKAHTKILSHPCDRYYRYYLTTVRTK